MPLNLIIADITTLTVDAIVNAANPTLLGGGGVDGAIHRAAGAALLQACRALPESSPGIRCATGEAVITDGFALPAHHVIHTVGPIWQGGTRHEATLLARCYRQSMRLLREGTWSTIAFPAISCGAYGYPAVAAAHVAVATLRDELLERDDAVVTLCSFSHEMHAILQQALQDH